MNSFANFALVDVGCSKVALVVPKQDGSTNSVERNFSVRCCVVEPVEAKKLAGDAEIARAEAFLRARKRAEAMTRTRLRRVFLLANEPSLKLVPSSQEQGYKDDLPNDPHREQRAPFAREDEQEKSPRETIFVNAVATDRNKRPLSFYAMSKRRWQFYTRLASYAGVSIAGFVSPAVALGQSLLVRNRALTAEETQAGTRAEVGVTPRTNEQDFVILDIGSHATGVAVFAAGVPCACRSWAFATASITTALAESFALTHARAAALQRNLVLSNSFLDSLLSPSSGSGDAALSERRFPRKDTFSNKDKRSSLLGATTQAVSQKGATRILASAYGSLFREVARFLECCTPHFSCDAPVYATGGGSLVAGSHVLASHLLTRCVFPYPYLDAKLTTPITTRDSPCAFGDKIAASAALACLCVLTRGGLMRASATLSSKPPWSRRLKIFSSREDTRDSVSSQQEEETSHA